MSMNSLCSWEELESYLEKLDESDLLDYIDRGGRLYKPSSLFYSREIERQPSVKMQVAAMLAVLGSFEEAEKIHKLRWENLGPAYDKLTNGILREFMLPL